MTKKKISVIIVDDSALIRNMYTKMLQEDPEIEVVDTAVDPYDAREKIKKHNPDVITLDIEMPKMDGIDFLTKIMKLRPMPVVMASTFTQKGSKETIQCLEIGAVDCIGKPEAHQSPTALKEMKEELIEKVKSAAKANIRSLRQGTTITKLKAKRTNASSKYIIFIGSSTGGVDAIKSILVRMPADIPPILITQHMPPKFTESFAKRLNESCSFNVWEAKDSQKVAPSNVYIAPGSEHLTIKKVGEDFICKTSGTHKVSGHCPSVDVLFDSAAHYVGDRAVGVMLTGMGSDGAKGMLKMKQQGAYNIGQNEASCVVYGMPKSASQLQATHKMVHLDNMAKEILSICNYQLG